MDLNPISRQEKVTDHFPTKHHHQLMTKNLGESKVSGEIHKHNLYPTTSFKHKEIITYLGTCDQPQGSNCQFDAENHFHVTLFGPGTHVNDASHLEIFQIVRHEYKHLQKIMAEQKKLDSPTQDEDTITKNCDRNNATTIVTQSQVGEKNNANHHKATNNIGSSCTSAKTDLDGVHEWKILELR